MNKMLVIDNEPVFVDSEKKNEVKRGFLLTSWHKIEKLVQLSVSS